MSDWVEIDGSYGEGGGQIIRTSVSLAAVTGRPVRVENVRAKRSKPGLQPQHLMAVTSAAQICGAELSGAEVGSTCFSFSPGAEVQPGRYFFDIGTAGSTAMVCQTLLLPLAIAGEAEVVVKGGTYNPLAPPADYVEQVYLPALADLGVRAEFECVRAGYYPKGGGEVRLRTSKSHLRPAQFTSRGNMESLVGNVVTSSLREHVAQRGVRQLEERMEEQRLESRILDRPAVGAGAAVVLVCRCEGGFGGFTGLGERGKPMERVADDAADEFHAWWDSGAAVDEHLADQLVLPAALAGGESRWHVHRVTEHLRTVLWLVAQFLQVESAIEERSDGTALVRLRSS
jgi:RNA 3'-terminal phosphate cyclase (ATP)